MRRDCFLAAWWDLLSSILALARRLHRRILSAWARLVDDLRGQFNFCGLTCCGDGGNFAGMSGKTLAIQVAALPEPERKEFITELLQHQDLVEDLEDILLFRARRDEPSIPFDVVVAGLKRDKLL